MSQGTEAKGKAEGPLVERFVPAPIQPVAVEDLTPPTAAEAGSSDEVAVMDTDYGRMVLEFYPDVAPLHAANFKKLARAGFYDGTTFHRVIPEFVLQGGDPNSKDDNPMNDGLGGPPWHVKAEFNDRKHDRGILSMARSQDPNSAGSQFFICLTRARTQHLDNQYTVFGRVIYGMENAEDIGRQARDPQANADQPAVKIRSVRIVNRSEVGL
jgi:peptidyl-prolyl cis-trans isomerase B (cyclophilin B)